MVGFQPPFVPVSLLLPDIQFGTIGMWHGSELDIPYGWTLCDGTKGTPDLVDKFIVASGPTYPKDSRGGDKKHDHDFTSDGHVHDLSPGGGILYGGDYSNTLFPRVLTGTTNKPTILPKYYSICYVMKLPEV